MTALRAKNEHLEQRVEIDTGSGDLWVVMFLRNGEYVVSGDKASVRVWRVGDGKQVARMETGTVNCLATSTDGRWIAAGTLSNRMFLWNANTFENVGVEHRDSIVTGIDFSPDSTKLVVATVNFTASVLDISTRKRVFGPLHNEAVIAAKYSPHGDRVASATSNCVRVWDSKDGRLLQRIPVSVVPLYNTGLLWSNDHLLVASQDMVTEIDVSTGLVVANTPVPPTICFTCIALPQHTEFVACSNDRTVTFWDRSTHARLGLIQQLQGIRSVSLSTNDQFLAIGTQDGKIIIQRQSRIAEPDIDIDDAVLDSWERGQLADAKVSLTRAILASPSHHALASRAIIRARSGEWDAAKIDAEESIAIQPSIIAYLAKSLALVGKGQRYEAYETCDYAFRVADPTHVNFLLLMKAIVMFMAGETDDAISFVEDLITTVALNSICYQIQAYMYVLSGKSHMENNNYEGAIQSLERAKLQYCRGGSSHAVAALISGWKVDDLDITIRQRLCEALYAAGHGIKAGESLLEMVNDFEKYVYVSESITEWVSDFARQCLSFPKSDGEGPLQIAQSNETLAVYAALGPMTPTPLLQEWAKATLLHSSWKDALVASSSFTVPRCVVYQAICERLEKMDHMAEAAECCLQLLGELEKEKHVPDAVTQWVLDFKRRCSSELEHLGDTAMSAKQHDDAVSLYSTAASVGSSSSSPGLRVKQCMAFLAKVRGKLH